MRELKGKSLVKFVKDYVVLDIETTGLCPGFDDIIEFSGLRVRDNKIIDKYSTLIKPDCHISQFIEELTGITEQMLENAPSIDEVMNKIISFIGSDTIVGHNVNFDVNFIYDFDELIYRQPLKNDYIDTLRLSKKLIKDVPNHKLETLAKRFNKTYFPSHRSMNDCLATYELFCHISEFANDNNLELKKLYKKRHKQLLMPCANVSEIDEENPLFGRRICFTGTLATMLRKDALQLVANRGGIPSDSVTQGTNILVLGDVDYKDAKANKKSSKLIKAESLVLKGADLIIISETTFLDLINEKN